MNASLDRIILYVQNVSRLAKFYKEMFELPVVEEIKEEWVVFRAGACELALPGGQAVSCCRCRLVEG
jgi:catechol-2,3-dioxygenase